MSERAAFLARIAERQGPPPAAGPHPPPPPPETVPEVRTRALDGIAPNDVERLSAVFRDQARRVDVVVHEGEASEAIGAVVREHDITTAVASPDPAARRLVPALRARGVIVGPPDIRGAAAADLGVTGSVAAIAATGSVVVDADLSGGRTTSLLPRVHLCVVDRADLVAGTADVLRAPLRPLPPHRVIITGPSRTGDIEQILTLGAHGPVALHVLLVG